MSNTRSSRRTPAARLLALTTLGAVLGACGSNSSSGSSSTASTSAESGQPVTVTETDFKIALSRSTFAAGAYTFTIMNKGATTHALDIDGPGLSNRTSDTVSPGASTSMTVTLQKGTYDVSCPVDGHRGLGMQTTIKVS
jgi:plastocyanin